MTKQRLQWAGAIGVIVVLGVTRTIPDPADNDYARVYAEQFGLELP